MNRMALIRLAFSLALVLPSVGCATALLSTRVEIYNPKVRKDEIQSQIDALPDGPEKKRKKSLLDAIATRLDKEHAVCASQECETISCWIDLVEKRVNSFREVTSSFDSALKLFSESQDSEKFTKDMDLLRHKHREELDDLVDRTMNSLEELRRTNEETKQISPAIEGEISHVVRGFTGAYADAIDIRQAGDTVNGTPPSLRVPTFLRSLTAASEITIKQFAQVLRDPRTATRITSVDKSGILRPDEVMETLSDPLLTMALKDTGGWDAVPLATSTEADGDSKVAVVRDGAFSFSVHTLINDPTGIVRQRLRIASSTVNILGRMAGSALGVRVPASPPAPSGAGVAAPGGAAPAPAGNPPAAPGGAAPAPAAPAAPAGAANAQAQPGADEGKKAPTFPVDAYASVARDRLRDIQRLLSEAPPKTASAETKRAWIQKANAMFQSPALAQ